MEGRELCPPLACVGGVKREQGSARPVDGTDLCSAPQCQRASRATARPGAARGVRRRERRLGGTNAMFSGKIGGVAPS